MCVRMSKVLVHLGLTPHTPLGALVSQSRCTASFFLYVQCSIVGAPGNLQTGTALVQYRPRRVNGSCNGYQSGIWEPLTRDFRSPRLGIFSSLADPKLDWPDQEKFLVQRTRHLYCMFYVKVPVECANTWQPLIKFMRTSKSVFFPRCNEKKLKYR